MNEKILSKVIEQANKTNDGHFTLMKFTTNWRACYGTPNDRFDIDGMVEGKTADDALLNLLANPVYVK